MTPNRPYLIRAVNEWLLDNRCTPHLLVNAEAPGVDVPRQYIQDGKIVLNIGPNAVEGLRVSNEEVTFLARFSGRRFGRNSAVDATKAAQQTRAATP